jgi:Uma2 family endonuclease
MAIKRKLLTAEEFYELPDDGTWQELVSGEVRTSPPPGGPHGEIAMRVGIRVGAFVEQHELGRVFGESGWVLTRGPDTVRAPDFAFVTAGRIPPGPMRDGYPDLVPDLAVEVLSPSDRPGEVREKLQQWLDAGVRLIWVLDPRRRTVTVYRPGQPPRSLGSGDTVAGEDVVPGFSCPVADLFPA